MITPEKIEEWIKEAEQRPSSAPLIIQFIANRLRDLAGRNEELLAENIALLTGKRVEEYQQRIAHLEYQLELLKRQLKGELSEADLQLCPSPLPSQLLQPPACCSTMPLARSSAWKSPYPLAPRTPGLPLPHPSPLT